MLMNMHRPRIQYTGYSAHVIPIVIRWAYIMSSGSVYVGHEGVA